MQRKYSEPNTYIDNLPKGKEDQEELYDDVDVPEISVVCSCIESFSIFQGLQGILFQRINYLLLLVI